MGIKFKQIVGQIWYDPYETSLEDADVPRPYVNITQLPIQVLYDTAVGQSGNIYVKVSQLPIQVLYDPGILHNSCNCCCFGVDNLSGNTPLYTQGAYISSSGLDGYIYGAMPVNSGVNLYNRGYDTISTVRGVADGLSWYTFTSGDWNTFSSTLWDTFLSSTISGSIAPDLYTYGAYLSNSGIDLYIKGWDTNTSGVDLYILGCEVVSSGCGFDCYINGANVDSEYIPLYLKVDNAYYSYSGLDCVLYNTYNASSSGVDLYIQVDGENEGYIPFDDNIPLFLQGVARTLITHSVDLYCRSALGTTNSFTNMYLCGGTIINSGINLVLPHTRGVYNNSVKLYLSGY